MIKNFYISISFVKNFIHDNIKKLRIYKNMKRDHSLIDLKRKINIQL